MMVSSGILETNYADGAIVAEYEGRGMSWFEMLHDESDYTKLPAKVSSLQNLDNRRDSSSQKSAPRNDKPIDTLHS
jgi:hypothetical protein